MHQPRSHYTASPWPEALLHSPHTLSHLHLYDRHITSLSTIPNLAHCTSLTDLNLHSNLIAALDPTPAFSLHQLAHSLTALDLSSNLLAHLPALPHLPHLTHLNLASNTLRHLPTLHPLPALCRLNVSYNEVGELDGLGREGGGARLVSVDLRGNRISGTRQLHWLKGCTALQELWLTDSDSGGGGEDGNGVCGSVNYLATVLTCVPSLRRLDGMDVTDTVSRPTINSQQHCSTITALAERGRNGEGIWLLMYVSFGVCFCCDRCGRWLVGRCPRSLIPRPRFQLALPRPLHTTRHRSQLWLQYLLRALIAFWRLVTSVNSSVSWCKLSTSTTG